MKNLKRVLALVTVFAMVMSVSAFAHVWQYDDVIENWTDTQYESNYAAVDTVTEETVGATAWNWADTVQEAIDESQSVEDSAATIVMTSDETITKAIEIDAGEEITLDLNGNDLTRDLPSDVSLVGEGDDAYTTGRTGYAIDNYGTFTLDDTSEEGDGTIDARGIENLMLVSKDDTTYSASYTQGELEWLVENGYTVEAVGNMTINGGTIIARDGGGGGASIWNDGILTVNDG